MMNDKIQTALKLFKELLPEVKGKFRAMISERNGNEVDIFDDSGLYCTINIRSRTVKGI